MTIPSFHVHVEYVYDRSGNQAGIGGVWLVPDTFEIDAEYASFTAAFKVKHPTKSGRLTERLRKTQGRAWLKHMSTRFEKVPFSHREDGL